VKHNRSLVADVCTTRSSDRHEVAGVSAEPEQRDRELDARALVHAIDLAIFIAQVTNSPAVIDSLFAALKLASERQRDVDEAAQR
jgi:hypothetical protein